MPAIFSPATILVTGANGFIGLWIIRELLRRGYSVRGTVRTPSAARDVEKCMEASVSEGVASLQCIVVPDIAVGGAFDEAVKGIDGIIHTASPVTFAEEDPATLINPAVGGTLSILRSAMEHGGQNLRRVVITSSIAAVMDTYAPPGLYTEDMWNDEAIKLVEEQGKDAPGGTKYMASKTIAEKAAWSFVEHHKAKLNFDLCTILPSWTMGPLLKHPPSPSAIGSAMQVLYDQLFTLPPPSPREPQCFNYVDVRDVTELHIRALEVPAAGGERIIASSHICGWQDWLNAAHDLGVLPRLDKRVASRAEACPPHPTCSNEKAKRIFGIRFKTVPETFRDVYRDLSARGWLSHLEE
ncbi:NAD(P)-binding protein [Trametes punicea]|nr:NAD(P)-binding protein [Trametes punicea]